MIVSFVKDVKFFPKEVEFKSSQKEIFTFKAIISTEFNGSNHYYCTWQEFWNKDFKSNNHYLMDCMKTSTGLIKNIKSDWNPTFPVLVIYKSMYHLNWAPTTTRGHIANKHVSFFLKCVNRFQKRNKIRVPKPVLYIIIRHVLFNRFNYKIEKKFTLNFKK